MYVCMPHNIKNMKFCPDCGVELTLNSKFCVACGTPLFVTNAPPVTPTPQPQPAGFQQSDRGYYQTREDPGSGYSNTASGKTNIIRRVINIIIKPKQEWIVIAGEQPDVMRLIGGYTLILALIPAVSAFVKYGIIGFSFMGYTSRSISSGIQTGLVQLFSAVFGVYLLAWVIDLLAPNFNSEKNFGRSLQLAVYASTPQWIAGILLLFSTGLSMLILVFGLYAIYLLAVGMPVLKGTPKDKLTGYIVLTIVAMIVTSLVVALVFGAIMGLLFAGGTAIPGM